MASNCEEEIEEVFEDDSGEREDQEGADGEHDGDSFTDWS